MSLYARLFLLVVLALLPGLGVQVYNELDARRLRAREGEEQALRATHLIGESQARIFSDARQLMTSLGRIAATPGSGSWCDALFAELGRAYRQYPILASYDDAGHRTCSASSAAMQPETLDGATLALARGAADIVTVGYRPDTHPPTLLLARAFPGEGGAPGGVILAGLDSAWLNAQIADKSLPPHSTVSLVGRNGIVLARYPQAEKFVGHPVPGGQHGYMFHGEGAREALGFDGIRRIYAYAPLPGGPDGLVVSVGMEGAEILKGVEAANVRGLLVIPAQAILAIVLAILGARCFLRPPLGRLLKAADALRRGDHRTRVGFGEERSEFGRLGAAFDTMAAAVGAREEELELRVAERTRALQAEMQARQSAEAALYQAQKLEAVGRLTGGVAHDFNNLLAAVVGNLEMALSRVGTWEPVASRLEAALASAQRGARLTQHLLSFARKQTLRPEILDLNQYIEPMLDVMRRLLRSDIVVRAELAPQAWPVRVDPNQLESAILNLALNARDAMPDGGELVIETRNVTLPADAPSDRPAGDFVALTLRDTGIGMPPEVLDKVFEPFFTTKEVGAGSGLGLSMVHGFARQSAGSVGIESTPGAGTAATLYLPRSAVGPKPQVRVAMPRLRGQGRIMLVDDNDDVRRVLGDMLAQAGFTVSRARDGAEALAAARRDDYAFDALVADVVMPGGLNGLQLASTMRRERPGIGLVLISGHAESWDANGVPSDAVLLTKPFGSASLITAVTAVSAGASNTPRNIPA